MKNLMFLIVIAVIGFMYSGCSDMNQDIMSANSDRAPVPFKGDFSGEAIVTGMDPNPPYTIHKLVTCTGNSTHMGLFTAEIFSDAIFTSPTGGILLNGDGWMTGANGDKLHLVNMSGEFQQTGSEVDFTFSGTVSGGTGRFIDATGEFSGSGHESYYSQINSTVTYSWTGSMLY